MEIWKDVNEYEGLYQISNHGRLRRFRVKDGQVGYKLSKDPLEMATIDNGHGYNYVSLTKDGKRKNYYVHRLVAEHFIGAISDGKVVNHKDFDKKNNRVDNLEIVTQRQNIMYSRQNMSKPKRRTGLFYITIKKNKYEVTVNRKYLGRYKTAEEAVKVRDKYIEEIDYR